MGNRKLLVLVVDGVRSAENVGSMLRTADGLGVTKVLLCGITPYPQHQGDERMPYLAAKIEKKISKTALGAERSVSWAYYPDVTEALSMLKDQGYQLIALEQTIQAKPLSSLQATNKVALIVGNEIHGVSQKALALADIQAFMPMLGQKESFNVSVAAAMALFYLRTFKLIISK